MAVPGELIVSGSKATQLLLALDGFRLAVYNNAINHGFWEGDGCTPGEKIALMHQELSELLDNYRDSDTPSSKIPPHTNAEEEAADLMIRLLDFCQHEGLDVTAAMIAKHNYNVERPYKHGREKY